MKRDDIRIRDPFVYVENGVYFLLGTTGDDPWGKGSDMILYKSADLTNFERVMTATADGELNGYSNIWAPELHKYRGKYYIIVSADRGDVGRGSFMMVSDSLTQPFTLLTGKYITPAGWGCLDATLFISGGKPYLCFANEWMTPITRDGDGSLYIAELNEDLTEIIGEPKKIVSGKHSGLSVEVGEKVRGYIAEGPYLYNEGDDTVLLWSTVTQTGYSVIKSVSRTGIMGDYEYEKTIFSDDGGHSMVFTDNDGKRKIALHAPNKTPNERLKIFDLE